MSDVAWGFLAGTLWFFAIAAGMLVLSIVSTPFLLTVCWWLVYTERRHQRRLEALDKEIELAKRLHAEEPLPPADGAPSDIEVDDLEIIPPPDGLQDEVDGLLPPPADPETQTWNNP